MGSGAVPGVGTGDTQRGSAGGGRVLPPEPRALDPELEQTQWHAGKCLIGDSPRNQKSK